MKSVFFEIDLKVIERFPEATVAAMLIDGLDAAAGQLEHIAKAQLDAACNSFRQQGLDLQNLVEDVRIAAWRSAFKQMALKPSTYKSSAEQLVRRLLKNEGIATPLQVVNLYCALSAKHIVPMGGYDATRLPESRVVLRFAQPQTDLFTPLAGRVEDMPIKDEVAVYASAQEVICWAFNYRDSRTTCLREGTQTALFFSEAVARDQRQAIALALSELRDILVGQGTKASDIYVADGSEPKVAITL